MIGSREWVTVIRITKIECEFADFAPLLEHDSVNDIDADRQRDNKVNW